MLLFSGETYYIFKQTLKQKCLAVESYTSEFTYYEKPAAGAARFWILYRSPPLENVQKFRKGGGDL